MKEFEESYGYGDGSGYGYGYGEMTKKYLAAVLEEFDSNRRNCVLGFWRSDKQGKPANGGSGQSRKVGMIEEIPGPLRVCSQNALHATLVPSKWKGERWWVIALHGPVQHDTDKMGGLKREIIADLGLCPF